MGDLRGASVMRIKSCVPHAERCLLHGLLPPPEVKVKVKVKRMGRTGRRAAPLPQAGPELAGDRNTARPDYRG